MSLIQAQRRNHGPPSLSTKGRPVSVTPTFSHELNDSSGLVLGLGDILLSRRSRKHSSLPVEAAAERGNACTHGKNDRNRWAYFPTWHDRTADTLELIRE